MLKHLIFFSFLTQAQKISGSPWVILVDLLEFDWAWLFPGLGVQTR